MANPKIGDFRSVSNNTFREEVKVNEELVETKIDTNIDDTKELTAAEKYRARLAEANISLEQASVICDAVLEKGYYEEYVKISKTRVLFRTRLYEDELRLQKLLEVTSARLQITQNEMIARYNLAASLYEWKGQDIKHGNESDFQNALTVISKLPSAIVTVLIDALARFDAKILLIFSEGAIDSF